MEKIGHIVDKMIAGMQPAGTPAGAVPVPVEGATAATPAASPSTLGAASTHTRSSTAASPSTGRPAPRKSSAPSSAPAPPSSPSTPPPSSGRTATAPAGRDEPACPTCRGLGWLRPGLTASGTPFGHPDWGQLVPCDDCRVVHRLRIARLDRYSSRRGHALDQSFDNFVLAGAAATARPAYNAALCFAREPRGWLVIHGPKGNGKSHLAAAISNELIEQARTPTLFLTAPDLLHALRAEVRASRLGSAPDPAGSDLLDVVREAPVLVLDDLGAERWTAWAEEQIFLLFDYRYRLRLPTVVLTNEELDSFPGRIYSRLGDRQLARVVYNPAPDYRLGNGRVTW